MVSKLDGETQLLLDCLNVINLFLLQADWKLVAMSASYRLKQPDRRFDELKNYATELQTHINNIIKIRMVPQSFFSVSRNESAMLESKIFCLF